MEMIIGDGKAGGPNGVSGAAGDLVMDSDTQNFGRDVIEASASVPVIVDFWAPWCGPCKTLGPLLEKVVNTAAGRVKMVKINVDENQPLAQQLRIQSIPAVYAFSNGQPVDGFVGALSESQIRQFVEKLVGGPIGPSPVDQLIEAAREALANEDAESAGAAASQALQADVGNPVATALLARALILLNQLEDAQGVLDELAEEHQSDSDVKGAHAALALALDAANAADPEEVRVLRDRLAANENDHEARFELAKALNAAGQQEAAADELLTIVRAAPSWNEEAARKELLVFFDAWGQTSDITVEIRRRLSSILFS